MPSIAPPAQSLPWRTGRHNAQIVYAQAGEQAADTDEMVAVFFDPATALAHVQEHNGALAGL